MSVTWNWNPLIGLALLLPTWAYAHGVMYLWRGGRVGRGVTRWQVAAFVSGIFTLFVALVSPLDKLGEMLFSAHMIQHLLLMVIAPPLVVLGTPPSIFLWVLPLRWRQVLGRVTAQNTPLRKSWKALSHPFFAWLIHGAAIWLWHLPGLYQAALVDPTIHLLEHGSFLGTALLFWYAVLPHGRKPMLIGALLIFTTALHSSVLGALITFSTTIWYPIYKESVQSWGLSALEDQQLAGLMMWIPAGVIYLIAVLALLGSELQRMDKVNTEHG